MLLLIMIVLLSSVEPWERVESNSKVFLVVVVRVCFKGKWGSGAGRDVRVFAWGGGWWWGPLRTGGFSSEILRVLI